MFNIRFYRDVSNKDLVVRKKIKGIIITCGYNCMNYHHCKYAGNCNLKSHYRFHNFSVRLRLFCKRVLKINFHIPIYIQKHSVDLSGTTKCPHQVPRNYSCWNCKHHDGQIDGNCLNKRRHQLIKEGKLEDVDYPYEELKLRCKLFEPNDFYCDYDVETGEYL